MRKTSFYQILFLVAYWTLAAAFIVSHEQVALTNNPACEGTTPAFATDFVIATLGTLVISIFVGSFDVFVLSRLLRKRPYGFKLMTKTGFWVFCIVGFISLIVILIIASRQVLSYSDPALWEAYAAWLMSPLFATNVVYWGINVFIALFLVQVGEKFGPGVPLGFLRGQYHRPKEEDRIFMFLDLKSSTTLAEQLGHLKYSRQ